MRRCRSEWRGTRRIVRTNAFDTRYAYRDLIEVVGAAGEEVDLVMIPKVNSPDRVRFVDRLLTPIELYTALVHGKIGIEA